MRKLLQMSLLAMSLTFIGCAGMKKSSCSCGHHDGGKKECKMDGACAKDAKECSSCADDKAKSEPAKK